ncbi:MAG: serine hydrolase domain-containing protein [Candidatus Thorarchaeota archaeon]
MSQRAIGVVLMGLFAMMAFSSAVPAQAINFERNGIVPFADRDYWPTEEWRNASPSDHGVDETYLDAMMTSIEEEDHNIHSVIVIKNGYIVWEEYPSEYYDMSRRHHIQSCTKSFTSTLIGIAIHEGFIDNTSQRMVDIFSDWTIDNLDSRKESITLEHMLTMTEGMYWTEHDYPYTDDRNTLKQMWDTNDPIQHILDQPMVREPGEEWHYNSGMSVLLGAILEIVTGQSVESFAEDYLFNRIGIGNYLWQTMPSSDVLHTDGGLYLTPRNMARLGYLMLNNGTWDGVELISPEWVSNATQSKGEISGSLGYGYQWWIFPDFGFYAANGHYEQKIYVAPDDDLVVVFTAHVPDDSPHPTDNFMVQYILPSVGNYQSSEADSSLDLILNLGIVGVIVLPLVIGFLFVRHKSKHYSN